MKFKANMPASLDTTYADDAFDNNIGKMVPVLIEPGTRIEGKLLDAKVIKNGKDVELTIEI